MTGLVFDHGLTLSRMLATQSAEDLLLDDHVALQVLVDEMTRNRDIVHVAVSDRAGTVVASTNVRLVGVIEDPLPAAQRLFERDSQSVHAVVTEQGRSSFLFDSPVHYQQHELGRIRIGLSTDALVAVGRNTLISLVAVLLVTLMAVLVGAYVHSRRLTAPMETLRNALRQITRGRLDNRIHMHRTDEFERVFDAYNTMADSLEARIFIAQSAKRFADDPGSNDDARMSASMTDTLLIDAEVIAAAEKDRPAS
jgi:serine/threonine-protein kinase